MRYLASHKPCRDSEHSRIAKARAPWEQVVRRLPLANLVNITLEHLAAYLTKFWQKTDIDS